MQRQFTKDGRVATATSPAEAVRLAYDGWQEAAAVTLEPESEPEPDAETEGAPASSPRRAPSKPTSR